MDCQLKSIYTFCVRVNLLPYLLLSRLYKLEHNINGGTAIGSSIDGQNFIVNPTQTTTYYAEKVSARRDSIINYTGGVQTYIVPDSVFSIDLDIAGGASGLKQVSGASEYRGKGGRVTSTMNVNPGDTLYLYVGGIGSSSNGGSGGWNGEVKGALFCGRWWCFRHKN